MITNEQIDKHLDAVLRASGSALKHYTMQKSLDDMRAAMRAAMVADGAPIESLAEVAETLDNLAGALALPFGASVHVTTLRHHLPELRDKLRNIYTALTGDNPWSTHP